MKIATIIARILLGLVFVVFGLNVFFNFIPTPPPPKNEAGAFMGALFSSGYLYAVKCFEIAGGLLLLIGRKVPLGLTLLGPVLVNILFYDIFLDHTGLPIGIVVAALYLFLLWVYRAAFAGLLSH
jgi:putative oxidoreductase